MDSRELLATHGVRVTLGEHRVTAYTQTDTAYAYDFPSVTVSVSLLIMRILAGQLAESCIAD